MESFKEVQDYRLPRKFFKFSRNDAVADALVLSLRGMSEVRDEAIYNLAYLRDSITNTSARFYIIDCHDFR